MGVILQKALVVQGDKSPGSLARGPPKGFCLGDSKAHKKEWGGGN